MKPALASAWELQIRNGKAYVHRRHDDQPVAALNPAEAILFGLIDGSRSWAALRDILVQAVGPRGLRLVSSVETRLRPLFVYGQRRTPNYSLDALGSVATPDSAEGLRPLPGPRVLHWWVTRYCPRRCVYCFARPIFGGKSIDAEITRDQLKQVFEEAVSLGTENLLVAGAEPFLREDLPEVMGDALAVGITPLVTTKFPISRALAERLANAGVRHISLSVDTLDKEESFALIGSRDYPVQVCHSVDNLNRAGVRFSIQTVVTRLNPISLRAVAAFAADRGAKLLQVVPFGSVSWPIGHLSNEQMILEHSNEVDKEVELLSRRFASLKIEKFEELGTGNRSDYQCDIGMTKLFFLPDGVVHRCYKLTHDDRLRGKDLRQVSVAQAWHDPDFANIISPPQENYAGSSCHRCARFASCHADGRCIYRAFVDHGHYEAMDRSCSGPFSGSTSSGQ